jgi:hypothetical protein
MGDYSAFTAEVFETVGSLAELFSEIKDNGPGHYRNEIACYREAQIDHSFKSSSALWL